MLIGVTHRVTANHFYSGSFNKPDLRPSCSLCGSSPVPRPSYPDTSVWEDTLNQGGSSVNGPAAWGFSTRFPFFFLKGRRWTKKNCWLNFKRFQWDNHRNVTISVWNAREKHILYRRLWQIQIYCTKILVFLSVLLEAAATVDHLAVTPVVTKMSGGARYSAQSYERGSCTNM